jgi:anthranilate phosphoribosyltransferase
MTDAYVHVVAEPSAVSRTATEIAEGENIETVHLVTGEHDIVAQIDAESKDDIADIVTEQIHSASGVVETVTSVAFEP